MKGMLIKKIALEEIMENRSWRRGRKNSRKTQSYVQSLSNFSVACYIIPLCVILVPT